MTMYYSLTNDKIVTHRQIQDAALIIDGITVSDDAVDDFVKNCKGVRKKVESPNLERMVKNGQANMAAGILAEQNKIINMTVVEAKRILLDKYGDKEAKQKARPIKKPVSTDNHVEEE